MRLLGTCVRNLTSIDLDPSCSQGVPPAAPAVTNLMELDWEQSNDLTLKFFVNIGGQLTCSANWTLGSNTANIGWVDFKWNLSKYKGANQDKMRDKLVESLSEYLQKLTANTLTRARERNNQTDWLIAITFYSPARQKYINTENRGRGTNLFPILEEL